MSEGAIYNEPALLSAVSNGDEQAFRALYDHYRKKIWFIGWKLLKSESEADDVVQEIFSVLWAKKEILPRIEYFNAYINTMARNFIYNLLRQKAYEETYILETLFKDKELSEDGDAQVDFNELHRIFQKAINQLPPQQQTVFELGKIKGLKQEEIAEQMGLSRLTVKKHMALATESVRAFLRSGGKYGLLILSWLTIH
jgi:RNA polymerase sigma-70 factor (family 1)